jgi:hypothetical protein
MLGWVKYLVYIMSFFIPPVGVVTFWVFLGRGEELGDAGKWSFVFAFAGAVVCLIVAIALGATNRMYWPGMGRW